MTILKSAIHLAQKEKNTNSVMLHIVAVISISIYYNFLFFRSILFRFGKYPSKIPFPIYNNSTGDVV